MCHDAPAEPLLSSRQAKSLAVAGLLLLWPGCPKPEAAGDAATADMAGGRIDASAAVIEPPPLYCLGDGGMAPDPPGGTLACPDDKNLEGCPCQAAGLQAQCWPGLRKNRNLGICLDGQTTCKREVDGLRFGPCENAVLPVEGAVGKEGCGCISGGRWAVSNIAVCIPMVNDRITGITSAATTDGGSGCPPNADPPQPPGATWSANSVTLDCPGRYRLCYTLKAGSASRPLPTDCTVASVCTEADYPRRGVVLPLPPLPSFLSAPDTLECARQFGSSGGYGEMSVSGQTLNCDTIQRVVNRVVYCPIHCRTDPNAPDCLNCGTGGSGTF